MKTKSQNLFMALALLALSTINSELSSVFAQGTAFTYQGQLSFGSGPASGNYDFTFALFNNSSGINGQAGTTLTNLNVGVTNGLFTVTLDFGGVFTGTNYWLAIGVRSNGGGSFTALSPLQDVTPAPSAVYAFNAGASAISGSANAVAATNVTGVLGLAQLPGAVVTNGASSAAIAGNVSAASFTGAVGNLTSNFTASGTNTFSNGPVLIGTNAFPGTISGTNEPEYPAYHPGISTNSDILIWDTNVTGLKEYLNIVGGPTGGSDGSRYFASFGPGFGQGDPTLNLNTGINLLGMPNVITIPDAASAMCQMGQDEPIGWLIYGGTGNAFEFFCLIPGDGRATNATWPDGIKTGAIGNNGYGTIWHRDGLTNGNCMMQLIEGDTSGSASFGADVRANMFYLGPTDTNGNHTNAQLTMTTAGVIGGNGSGLTNLNGSSWSSGTITASNYFVPTNMQSAGPDMNRAYGDYATSTNFSFTAPINVQITNYQSTVVFVTNSSGSAIQITVPSTWHTNASDLFNVTNVCAVTITVNPGKWTNAVWKPLW